MSTNANTLARNLFTTLPIDADWTTDHNGNEIITLADSMIVIGDDEDGGLTWTRYTGNSEDRWDYSEADGTQTALGLGGYLDIGLLDTMEDLFVNFIGALTFSIIGYFYVCSRGKNKFAKRFIPVANNSTPPTEPKPTETE